MKTAQDLKKAILAMDHRGYPAYKSLAADWRFDDYILHIDHVQGDPFASPSRLSVSVSGRTSRFPSFLYETAPRRTALEDSLVRRFHKQSEKVSFKAGGSGKSGLIGCSRPGQEILSRTACRIRKESGDILFRFDVGFPARGRSIDAQALIRILFDYLPDIVHTALMYHDNEAALFRAAADLADDQAYIRAELLKRGLIAFVADGSVLPRESGVSQRPLKNAVAFESPASMRVTLDLPRRGSVTGMGIPRGITLIVGGGYHGKSTLLRALELGVYNHIAGDGREYVITDKSAVKLRAEDGRCIHGDDISMFIGNLPGGTDCTRFSTDNASGSTSQAAATVEALEAGSRVFLIDEDTCATNFMIRDELMARVVRRKDEPITPFLERIRPLYEECEISTVLAAGSSGLFFGAADHVIQMTCYRPYDITEAAKEAVRGLPLPESGSLKLPSFSRRPRGARFERAKIRTGDRDEFQLDRETVFLGQAEQLADREQTAACAYCLLYLLEHVFDGKKTIREALNLLLATLEKEGIEGILPGRTVPDLAMPRRQEIAACLNRYRKLHI